MGKIDELVQRARSIAGELQAGKPAEDPAVMALLLRELAQALAHEHEWAENQTDRMEVADEEFSNAMDTMLETSGYLTKWYDARRKQTRCNEGGLNVVPLQMKEIADETA